MREVITLFIVCLIFIALAFIALAFISGDNFLYGFFTGIAAACNAMGWASFFKMRKNKKRISGVVKK